MLDRILCRLRSAVFFELDALQGSPVKTAYLDLKKYDAMDMDRHELKEHQESAWVSLAEHAAMTTAFYRSFKNEKKLSNYPVIQKNLIREQQETFLSTQYDKKKLVQMRTSGSTGTPFVCYQNFNKKKRVNAEIIYYSEKAGYQVGRKLIFLRSLNGKNQKSKHLQWLQNEQLINISKLSDENIAQIIKSIKKGIQNNAMLLAYASTLDVLSAYFKKYNIMEMGGGGNGNYQRSGNALR